MSTPDEPHAEEQESEERLIEEVAGAFRPRDPRTLASLPAWHDLSPAGRDAAFELSVRMRQLEAALDPEGQSATVKAVLARIASA